MRLIPVIDVRNGLVVHGKGGRRDEYRPIVSRLTASAQPVDVARALIDTVHPAELYLADLDAIMGGPRAWALYDDLQKLGVALWVDAGVRESADVVALADAGIAGVICGLETLSGPAALEETIARLGPERVIFSLDLKDGRLLGNLAAWSQPEVSLAMPGHEWTAQPLLRRVFDSDVRRVIVLDLANVGRERGVGAIDLCRAIASSYPGLEVFTGGGIRGQDDLNRLETAGVAGALVASALHTGQLRAPLAAIARTP
jgi:phosphoribosylformimino-5-aminoimidazole carboxamide ribotide isomerase